MSVKQIILAKKALKTDTITVDGEKMKITELMGDLRSKMLHTEDMQERTRICWNGGTEKSEHMDEDEFKEAWKYSFSMVNDVTVAIGSLSGMFEKIKDTEKN